MIQCIIEFRVAAVSDNQNAFGLKQCVLVAKDGLAFKACKSAMFAPEKGETVRVLQSKGEVLSFAQCSFEIPERIKDAPQEVVDEIWV